MIAWEAKTETMNLQIYLWNGRTFIPVETPDKVREVTTTSLPIGNGERRVGHIRAVRVTGETAHVYATSLNPEGEESGLTPTMP